MKKLNLKVFPSNESTITVENDGIYGGAHNYQAKKCLGYRDGETVYIDDSVSIQFVRKDDNQETIAGLQSEQLVLILLDRTQKLNNRFPSKQNEKMIEGLQLFLDACKERVEERISRGVMGELKK